MRPRAAAVLVLATALALPVPWVGADQRLDQAAEAIRSGQPEDATALIGEVVETAGRVAAFVGLTERLIASGQLDVALEIAMGNARAWMRGGGNSDAVALLEPFVAHVPEHADLRALLGEGHLRAGNAPSATKHLEAAVAAGDPTEGTRFNLASALWESGHYEAAETLLRQGAAASGGDFLWHHSWGRLLHFLGRSNEAAKALRVAVGARPGTVDAHLDLAWAEQAADRLAAAEASFRRVIALDPSVTKAHYGLARLLARAGQQDQAAISMRTFESLFRAERARIEQAVTDRARLDHGWDLLRRGDSAKAIEHFRALGDLAEALDGLATALDAAGDPAAAVDVLERAVRLAPDDERLRRRLAAARLALGSG